MNEGRVFDSCENIFTGFFSLLLVKD